MLLSGTTLSVKNANPAGRSLPGFAVPINNSSAEHGQSEAEAILNLSLLKFQIAGQNQVQLGGRFCHKAAALVEDGLFQRVAGKTAVAGGAAVQRLTALVVAQKREGTALGKAVALPFASTLVMSSSSSAV